MANHVNISFGKKDGTVKSIGGWKGDIIAIGLITVMSAGIVAIGETALKAGKLVTASVKK